MKRMKLALSLLVVLTLGVGTVGFLQRPDLAGQLSGGVSITPGTRANSAVTGSWVDIGRATSVAMIIVEGITEAASYVVVQDSTAGSAVATRDSVVLTDDSTASYIDFNYRNAGRWVRALQRASGAAGDSNTTAVVFVGTARAR